MNEIASLSSSLITQNGKNIQNKREWVSPCSPLSFWVSEESYPHLPPLYEHCYKRCILPFIKVYHNWSRRAHNRIFNMKKWNLYIINNAKIIWSININFFLNNYVKERIYDLEITNCDLQIWYNGVVLCTFLFYWTEISMLPLQLVGVFFEY